MLSLFPVELLISPRQEPRRNGLLFDIYHLKIWDINLKKGEMLVIQQKQHTNQG